MSLRPRIAVMLAVLVVATSHVAAAPAAEGEATIIRDEYGVPHIFAETTHDLFYAFGYVQAQDRLWQAELLRRQATGRLAEVLGAGSVASDVEARLLFGPTERRDALYAASSESLRETLDAHAAGMNDWIAEASATGALPLEYSAFGVTPQPWTVDDTIAVAMALGANFGWAGSDELTTVAVFNGLVTALGPAAAAEVFADTHWLNDPDAPTTVPGADTAAITATPAEVDETMVRAAARVTADREAARIARERAGLIAPNHASNAAVIGWSLSRDGAPLLLGGPQMGYTAPQINHEVGLHGAGFNVTGMTIAGFPLVPIGVGDGFAWTLTSGGTDNSDIFVETLNPDDPTEYWFDGAWHPLDCRVEAIAVAGGDAVQQTMCATHHGPILAVDGTTAFSLQTATDGKELTSFEAWMLLGTATNIDEFASLLPGVAYNFNALYADNAGNIAYWHIGHMPIRAAGLNPLFPASGSGDAEWQGFLPFALNPQVVNPAQGWLASWNNKPAPGWLNSSADFWRWGGAHRVNTFINVLEAVAPGTATTRTLELLNRTGGFTTDTPSGQAGSVFVSTYLAEMMAQLDPSTDPRIRPIIDLLKRWDQLQVDRNGDGLYDGPQGAIFNAWWFALSERVFADDTAGLIDRFVIGNLIDRLLAGDTAALPLTHDYLDGETLREAVSGALVTALDALTAQFGSDDPAAWQQPIETIEWTPLGIGTVPDTIWMNRGTYNQIVHLGAGGDLWGVNVIAPGQSGDFRSPHFADQLPLYTGWRYKPMRLTAADLRGNETSVTVISTG